MAALRDEKILVTGPAGQIAFPLAARLARDNEVWGIARFSDAAGRERVEKAGIQTRKIDLADPLASTVVFMGQRTFPRLAALLIDAGLPADTPAILAEAVSTPEQAVTRTTVSELAERLDKGVSSKPALILYGALAEAQKYIDTIQDTTALDEQQMISLDTIRAKGGYDGIDDLGRV